MTQALIGHHRRLHANREFRGQFREIGQTVNPRALTITATGVNKVYDGTTMATVILSDNRLAGDTFTDAYTTAVFTTKNVGAGKP